MPICLRCAEKNPERARFCLGCGAEIATARQERKIVTLLFADIVGSSRLAASMDSEAFARLVGRFFAEMRKIVERHGGTVEGYAGDEIVAAFGLSVAHEDDACRAVRAACDMRQRLDELNPSFEAAWGATIAIRVGVNTGEVALSAAADQQNVFGDPANVAAGLEKAAESGSILIAGATYRLVRDIVEADPIRPVLVKGKSEPIPVYRLVAVHEEPAKPRTRSALVGREAELTLLEQAFELSIANSSSQLVTVLGEAGVGKSRVIAELTEKLAPRARSFSGRCLPYGDGITFWPLVEVIEQSAHVTGEDPPDQVRSKVRSVAADEPDADRITDRICQLIGAADSPASQEEIFWGVRRFIEALARRAPVIIAVDDIHWAEPLLLDLVEYLVHACRSVPLLMICMSRPEILESRPTWGGGKPNATSLLLHPLGDGESELLLNNLLAADAPDALSKQVLEAAGGNPLFIEETVAMLFDEGIVSTGVEVDDMGALPIPPTIHALLTARLELLRDEHRRVLQLAAVMGKVFPSQALLDTHGDEVGGALEALSDKDFVVSFGDQFAGSPMYMFRHLLIRDAAYQQMPKAQRAEAHQWYASWLESVLSDRLSEYEEIIGYHLEQAYTYRCELGAPDASVRELGTRGAAILRSAATRAARRGDLAAAVKLLSRGEAMLVPADPARGRLLADLGAILQDQGELERARSVLLDAVEISSSSEDEVTLANARLALARLDFFTNPSVASSHVREEAEAGLDILEKAGDLSGAASACYLISLVDDSTGAAPQAQAWLRRAVALAEREGDWGRVSIYRAVLLRSRSWGDTPMPDLIEEAESLLRWGQENDQVRAVIAAWRALARGRAATGDFSGAREVVAAYEDMCTQLDLQMYWAWGALDRSDAAVFEGDLERARSELRRAIEILEANREVGFLASVVAELANLSATVGAHEEAEEMIRYARQISSEDDAGAQVAWRRAAAKLSLTAGRPEAAVTMAREAVSLAAATADLLTRGRTHADLAEALAAAGYVEEAADSARTARALYEAKGVNLEVVQGTGAARP